MKQKAGVRHGSNTHNREPCNHRPQAVVESLYNYFAKNSKGREKTATGDLTVKIVGGR